MFISFVDFIINFTNLYIMKTRHNQMKASLLLNSNTRLIAKQEFKKIRKKISFEVYCRHLLHYPHDYKLKELKKSRLFYKGITVRIRNWFNTFIEPGYWFHSPNAEATERQKIRMGWS